MAFRRKLHSSKTAPCLDPAFWWGRVALPGERCSASSSPPTCQGFSGTASYPQLNKLGRAIAKDSTAFALVLTREGARNWVRLEVRTALDRVIAAQRAGSTYLFVLIIADDPGDLAQLPGTIKEGIAYYRGLLAAFFVAGSSLAADLAVTGPTRGYFQQTLAGRRPACGHRNGAANVGAGGERLLDATCQSSVP